MLKNIATAFSECTKQYENMASYSVGYTVCWLIENFGDGWKEIGKRIGKRNDYICEKYFIEIIGIFWPHNEENNVLATCISY